MRLSEKTYLMFVMMIVGVSLYFTVEYRERKAKRRLEEKKKDLGCEKGFDNIGFQGIE